jgi:hypothetical protein
MKYPQDTTILCQLFHENWKFLRVRNNQNQRFYSSHFLFPQKPLVRVISKTQRACDSLTKISKNRNWDLFKQNQMPLHDWSKWLSRQYCSLAWLIMLLHLKFKKKNFWMLGFKSDYENWCISISNKSNFLYWAFGVPQIIV